MRTIFLDRDGVINENSCEHVKHWNEFTFLPHVLTALRMLNVAGFRVFIVTNQAIINRGMATHATLDDIHARMIERIELSGGTITAIRYCPHDQHEQCACRKPQPGMLLDLANEWNIDLKHSYMVGDALTDIAAARAAGCRSVLVRTGRGFQQSSMPEMQIHRPDHVTAHLLSAVQWVLQQEGLVVRPTERESIGTASFYVAA